MEIYAEDNIDLNLVSPNKKTNNDQRTLVEILEKAKQKVHESEKSKQIHDQIQIDAFNAYAKLQALNENQEKNLKKFIEKSRKYYELKTQLDKELEFQSKKLHGLKSCLKEAKTFYQQSLKNLELISTEIHSQRQTSSIIASTSEINNTTELVKSRSFGNSPDPVSESNLKTEGLDSLCTSKPDLESSDLESNYYTQSSSSINEDCSKHVKNEEKNSNDKKPVESKFYNCVKKVKLRPQFRASLILKNP
jgi:hypothetical protein